MDLRRGACVAVLGSWGRPTRYLLTPESAESEDERLSMIHDARLVPPITPGDGPPVIRVPYRLPLSSGQGLRVQQIGHAVTTQISSRLPGL